MEYNKIQKRFDLDLGLNFRIVEDDVQPFLRIKSNIPALNYLTEYVNMSEALEDVLIKFSQGLSYFIGTFNIEDAQEFIKQNNIKELL